MDLLTHEWGSDNVCKYGCLCVHSIETHNNLCPNRVRSLQASMEQLRIERDAILLTLLNEQGEGEPPFAGWKNTCGYADTARQAMQDAEKRLREITPSPRVEKK